MSGAFGAIIEPTSIPEVLSMMRVLSEQVTGGEMRVDIDPHDAIAVVLISPGANASKAAGRLVVDDIVEANDFTKILRKI